MRRLTILFVMLVCAIPASSSHIVGGEFELLHISGNQYRLNLIWYFDVVNNPGRLPEIQEPNIVASIFRKSDNSSIRTVTLVYVGGSKVRVGYTQPECSSGEIITDKLVYTAVITLPESEFNDPEGYYISWQRCCRNYTIGNIVSENPNAQGIGAGQTFYLEFPAVVKDGQPFINSSPRLFPPLNDYACPGKPYYVDFAGVDDDGDSVVYSLEEPLNTSSSVALPPPSPRPYPSTTWRPGFALDRIVNGSPISPQYPDLRITRDGFLTVTPRAQGLFVFAVKIEEFRNKQKIGESRRDFQMLVTDCPQADAPVIKGRKLNETTLQTDMMTIAFNAEVADEERCIVVSVSDADATKEENNFSEVVRVKVVPLNFKGKALNLVQGEDTGVVRHNGTREFTICFPECPYFEGGPYLVGIVAYDDACALPLTDTLRVSVDVEAPPNQRVKFSGQDKIVAQLNEGDSQTWPFEAHDADGDPLIFTTLTDGFLLDPAGMEVTHATTAGTGLLEGTFRWDAYCDIYDFTKRTNYELRLLVDDQDKCNLNEPDTLTFKLNVVLPGNANPIADTDLTTNPQEEVVSAGTVRVLDKISFNVKATDFVDNDDVTIRLVGEGFRPGDYGMNFTKASAKGEATSSFSWDLTCSRFANSLRDQFTLKFLAIDSTNKCRVRKVDSVVVNIEVLPPLNRKPRLTISSLQPDVTVTDGLWDGPLGTPINLLLTVEDEDTQPQDQLHIRLVKAGGEEPPAGYVFTPVEGVGTQTATLQWNPDCSIFTQDIFEKEFYFDFRYGDDRCLTATADTTRVRVKIADIVSEGFTQDPPNVFTPNGDEHNEYFAMERLDENGNLVSVLPPDNCQGRFENIRIYNRWGTSVFTSSDRAFKWFGDDAPPGVYFYLIKFSNRQYKGSVSLRN